MVGLAVTGHKRFTAPYKWYRIVKIKWIKISLLICVAGVYSVLLISSIHLFVYVLLLWGFILKRVHISHLSEIALIMLLSSLFSSLINILDFIVFNL